MAKRKAESPADERPEVNQLETSSRRSTRATKKPMKLEQELFASPPTTEEKRVQKTEKKPEKRFGPVRKLRKSQAAGLTPAMEEGESSEENPDVNSELWNEEEEEEEEDEAIADDELKPKLAVVAKRVVGKGKKKIQNEDKDPKLHGDVVPEDIAMERWPHRYQKKTSKRPESDSKSAIGVAGQSDVEVVQAKRHYWQADVDGVIYSLNDNAHVEAEKGKKPYICKILEFFEGVDKISYACCQWYYRGEDTPVQTQDQFIDEQRVFISEIKDDNPLSCIIEKIIIVRGILGEGVPAGPFDYYFNMKYLVPFSTFVNLSPDELPAFPSETKSTVSSEIRTEPKPEELPVMKSKLLLLDLYAGCGAMSTGLCLGAKLAGSDLVTRWAVDLNHYACETLRNNHPETEVRNEMVGDFLELLKEWHKLCATFSLTSRVGVDEIYDNFLEKEESDDDDVEVHEPLVDDIEIFEVEKVLDICFGDPNEIQKRKLYLKICWKGYTHEYDTWEPIDGLGDCGMAVRDFVTKGYENKLLPLPGDVDILCGGPPCQGASGFNRFRNILNPLKDPRNEQIIVFMDIVAFLRPRYVLMENVVDILKLCGGLLGKYALGRLVGMNYQARLGMMAAGSYGLPQFRMRVFLWGALPNEKLPQFPLPTHHAVNRGVVPTEFEMCVVAGGKHLEPKLFLRDAIYDLPEVTNYEERDEIHYGSDPQSDFQLQIRLQKEAVGVSWDAIRVSPKDYMFQKLFDHRPLRLNNDDYERVCQIPKEKKANFRNLRGLRVENGKVYLDETVERPTLASGKFLVPDYAIKFIRGTSLKPFGRLWWDETVSTVVTRAEPHNQIILHPLQDRVLTIRENARLQGFPDYYKLFGPVKERYIQVGNAVAVPVARALGYSLAQSFQSIAGHEPTLDLPARFPYMEFAESSASES